VIDVRFEAEPEPIGCTANHPFWSEDRQAFVPAGKLNPGERLRTFTGQTTRVISLAARGSPEQVYNLEVDLDHVYNVSRSGVLVHNNCPNPGGRRGSPEHRAAVADAERMFKSVYGNAAHVAGGSKAEVLFGNRFPDLVFEVGKNIRIGIQVGRETLAGAPVAREVRALRDLIKTGEFDILYFLSF
jgi:hypothetical protein